MGHQFTVLSFEKKSQYEKHGELISHITRSSGIQWVPLSFTSSPPMLSKFYDMVRMRQKAFQLHRIEKFDMIHCRSYLAADIGLKLKKRTGVKFFFDMRGFWADEKKDGGSWDLKHPVFKWVYKYYKKKEAEYLQEADHIISLTRAGEKEIKTWPSYNKEVPITVIPCCADMEHFTLANPEDKIKARQLLHIANERFVISYLGSVGAWYMLNEMLELFRHIKKTYPSAVFLFISHSDPAYIKKAAAAHKIDPSDIIVAEASRQQVPVYMKASDLTLSFIKPVYSKLSSSPTKLGEVLSMGIPVISNSGVGDVETIINATGGGIVIHHFELEDYQAVADAIPELLKTDRQSIRQKAADFFDLGKGVDMYQKAYAEVLKEKRESK